MGKLDTNIETYQAMAETIQLLRRLVRDALRQSHGEEWEERGIPAGLRGFLAQRREREKTIQWRLVGDVDLLDFAGFENIGEIILADSQLAALFSSVSGGRDLLKGRFIELDSIQARAAYVRPLSDMELEFVVSFNERLRKIEPGRQPLQPPPAGAANDEPRPEVAPTRAAVPRSPSDGEAGTSSETGAGPGSAETVAAPRDDDANVTARALLGALAADDSVTVLTALYQEVTRLAELLWVEGRVAATPVWDSVRESQWYTSHFSKLGLRVVSDFYDIERDVARSIASGAESEQVRETLQERRFGEVLLALRELFRRHIVRDPAPPGEAPRATS